MKLSQLGEMCKQQIQKLSQRKSVNIHERIVMPNHIHIILILDKYTSILGDLLNRPYDGPTVSSIIKLLK